MDPEPPGLPGFLPNLSWPQNHCTLSTGFYKWTHNTPNSFSTRTRELTSLDS